MDLVGIGLRWLHLVAMATLLGGIVLARAVDMPVETLRRTRPVLHGSIGVILLTGLANYIRAMKAVPPPPASYHMLIGMKITLALVLFALVMIATRPATGPQADRRARMLLSIGAFLGVAIVLLAGVLQVL